MRIICPDIYGKKHSVDAQKIVDRESAYGVCITNQKVLLIQEPHTGRWELPGGGIEENETARQALIREFREETGATPEGIFTLLTEWKEYYFDLPSQQAWRTERKCYHIENILNTNKLLAHGNGEDSVAAKLVSLDKLGVLLIPERIREAILLVAAERIHQRGSRSVSSLGSP